MSPLFCLTLLYCCSIASGTVVKSGTDGFTHQIDLLESSGVLIQWKNVLKRTGGGANGEGEKWFEMKVIGKTSGYVGVGFSPNGAMTGADMVIGWVDRDGTPHLRDFHGESNGMPIEDKSQDYTLISARENRGMTTLHFQRKWDTCDTYDDIAVRNDTMRVIWALGDEDPIEDRNGQLKMTWHGSTNRGAQSAFIVDDAAFTMPFPDEAPHLYSNVKSWDMVMDNNHIDGDYTTYYCKIVKFPHLEKKHHMIGWKPILTPETKKYVHHIVFYECMIPPEHGGTESVFEAHTKHSGGRCYTKNMPPEWTKHCVTFLFVWVAGSEGEMMPLHVGSPLGEIHGGATYFMFEVHYDNPGLETFVDRSGVRIFYTDELRQYDGSVLLLGYRITPFLLLPPKQRNFITHGICSSECTDMTVPPSGIHIITTLLHAHLSAKKLRLRHFRNGTELSLIAEDNFYDFNYQQSRTLQKEITIFPGDELITECEYTTTQNNRIVLGGLASSQEMCQSFLVYYPRVNLMQCTSQYEFHDFFKGLGIDEVEGDVLKSIKMPYNPNQLTQEEAEFDPPDNAKELEETGDGASFKSLFDHIRISKPNHLRGKTVGQHLKDTNWSEDQLAARLEKYWKDGKHYAYCTGHGRKRQPLKDYVIPYPSIKKPLNKVQSETCKRLNLRDGLGLGFKSSQSKLQMIPHIIVFSVIFTSVLRY